jgi:hypothetical protein
MPSYTNVKKSSNIGEMHEVLMSEEESKSKEKRKRERVYFIVL